MRVIPVLDIMNGVVVRAVGGRREGYRPVVSKLTASTDPVEVAKALLEVTGASELYVADLDAIQHRNPQLRTLLPLHEAVPGMMVDAGVHFSEDVRLLSEVGLRNLVLGTETLAGPKELWEILSLHREVRVMVSIDLRHGELLDPADWGINTTDPRHAVDQAVQAGVRRFLLLDLARVGMNAGPGTEELCGELRRRYPDIELLVGGGVRNRDDVKRLEDAGADGVLVASALHDGTLP
jgi:phosphoribosylformimino-5-aminoimidazole carboxamide ribotide isomerase